MTTSSPGAEVSPLETSDRASHAGSAHGRLAMAGAGLASLGFLGELAIIAGAGAELFWGRWLFYLGVLALLTSAASVAFVRRKIRMNVPAVVAGIVIGVVDVIFGLINTFGWVFPWQRPFG